MNAAEYFELRDRVRNQTATPDERRRLSNERNRQIVRLLEQIHCPYDGSTHWSCGDLTERHTFGEPQS